MRSSVSTRAEMAQKASATPEKSLQIRTHDFVGRTMAAI
jgi:hypothetical protein